MRAQSSEFKVQRGFTLMELVVALTLLGLVVTVLYGAFAIGHRAVEKVQVRSGESQRLRALEEFIGSYLRSAYPYRLQPRDQAIFFSGTEHGVTFVSALSLGMGGRGMACVRVAWVEGSLILEEETPVHYSQCQGGGAGYRNLVVLQERVRDLRIDYWDPKSEAERWVEEWDGSEQRLLPRAVRLSLWGEKGEESRWLFPLMMSVLAP